MTPAQDAPIDAARWRQMPLDKQILNIVSELSRSKTWLTDQNGPLMKASLERAFELLDATAQCAAEDGRFSLLRELRRLREFLGEFYTDTEYADPGFDFALKSLLDFTPETHELKLEL